VGAAIRVELETEGIVKLVGAVFMLELLANIPGG